MKPYELIDGGLYKVGDKVVKYDWRNHQLNGRGDICCFYQECDGTLGVDIFDGVGLFGTNTLAIEPLPLTTEMLEKWGWSWDGGYAIFKLENCKYLQYYAHEKRLTEWYEGKDEWQNHANVKEVLFKCQCNSVHELQQALHLCGLTELADNFKVE